MLRRAFPARGYRKAHRGQKAGLGPSLNAASDHRRQNAQRSTNNRGTTMTAYTLFRAHYRIQRARGRSKWFAIRLALSEVIRPIEF